MISKIFQYFCLFLFSASLFAGAEADKSVLLSILARNKAHVLPHFLSCIDALEYDKEKITIYINTNNNQDDTQELLEAWIQEKGSAYREIIYDSHFIAELPPSDPHDWYPQRFKVLATIRNQSMALAVAKETDFYFVVDCDNFITPSTLRDLVAHDKPIIAPMLRAIGNQHSLYSNFFAAVNPHGYWEDHENYRPIVERQLQGTFEVPLVHCTYLIQTRSIPDLTYIDGSDDYEFVIFSRRAREKAIGQFICNEKPFGYILHTAESLSLQEEAALVLTLPELQSL